MNNCGQARGGVGTEMGSSRPFLKLLKTSQINRCEGDLDK